MKAKFVDNPQVQLTMTTEDARALMTFIGQFGDEVAFSTRLYNALSGVVGAPYDKYEDVAKVGRDIEAVRQAILRRARLINKHYSEFYED